MVSAEVVEVEHTIVIEGLCGKVKGLEQAIVTERNAGRVFVIWSLILVNV